MWSLHGICCTHDDSSFLLHLPPHRALHTILFLDARRRIHPLFLLVRGHCLHSYPVNRKISPWSASWNGHVGTEDSALREVRRGKVLGTQLVLRFPKWHDEAVMSTRLSTDQWSRVVGGSQQSLSRRNLVCERVGWRCYPCVQL